MQKILSSANPITLKILGFLGLPTEGVIKATIYMETGKNITANIEMYATESLPPLADHKEYEITATEINQ